MGFENTNFNTPIYTEKEKDPKKIFIISCEGSNTEPEYFKTIKEKLSNYIDTLIEVEVIPKESGASEPKHIVYNLDKFIKDKKDKYDYKGEYDEMWVVWDREKVPERKNHIKKMIPICQAKKYNIAMTNPAFELWLLLHVADISKYDKKELYENKRISNSKNFLDQELTEILGVYNKKKNKFNKNIVTIKNIKRAISQEKKFENELEKIIDNIGSNIGKLINKIIN